MKIAAYTIGSIERASSRLRSFYLFDLANKLNIEVIRPSRYRDALKKDVDLVHIQKIISIGLPFMVILYRLKGIKVVYDLDDQPGRPNVILGSMIFLGYFIVSLLSSVLVVNTQIRKLYWKKYLPFKKIIVIHDVADVADVNLKIMDRSNISSNDTFFWTGYSANLKSIAAFLDVVKTTNQYNLIVSTEEKAIAQLKNKYSFVEFIPWFDGVAYDPKINAKFMILNHSLDDGNSRFKSENKMLLAILAGFVPIVSRTPAYEKLAKLLGAEFLLFDHIDDIVKKIDKLRGMEFYEFFSESNAIIYDNYSKESVLSNFHKKVILS